MERADDATDPATPTEPEAWAVLLSVNGLGPAGFGALLAAYGGGRMILDAAVRRGAAARFARVAADGDGKAPFGAKVGEEIVSIATGLPERLATLRASGLTIVTLDDPAYPPRLRATELPPPVLLVRGELAALNPERAVAVVGTRRPSERGRYVAAQISAALVKAGAVVVSGLAVGIDGAAHAAAVAEERATVGVLGSGHERLYPVAHRRLAGEMIRTGGAVVSDLWPTARPSTKTFPKRNRVISGLSDATIVVEAGLKSGALITAKWALEQGRGLFLVPGPIDEPRSAGCLAWLREFHDEARLVIGIPELLVDLGLEEAAEEPASAGRDGLPARPPRPSLDAILLELGPTARDVGLAIARGGGSLDELVRTTGHAPATILSVITLLELRGLATSTYGRYRASGRLASTSASKLVVRPHSGSASRLPARGGPC